MSKIMGVGFLNGHKMRNLTRCRMLIKKFIEGNEVPTGTAFIDNENISLTKNFSVSHESLLKENITYSIKKRTYYVINYSNPLIFSNDIVGIYDNSIKNSMTLFDYFGLVRKNIGNLEDIDGEVVFKLIDHYSKVKNFNLIDATRSASQKLIGRYSCAFINRKTPHNLWLFRNFNPIKLFCYPEAGIFMFAQKREMIEKAAAAVGLHNGKELKIPEFSGVGLNLEKNTYTIFNLF